MYDVEPQLTQFHVLTFAIILPSVSFLSRIFATLQWILIKKLEL